jgi:ribulose bisphosphate carboxylase small subunit
MYGDNKVCEEIVRMVSFDNNLFCKHLHRDEVLFIIKRPEQATNL